MRNLLAILMVLVPGVSMSQVTADPFVAQQTGTEIVLTLTPGSETVAGWVVGFTIPESVGEMTAVDFTQVGDCDILTSGPSLVSGNWVGSVSAACLTNQTGSIEIGRFTIEGIADRTTIQYLSTSAWTDGDFDDHPIADSYVSTCDICACDFDDNGIVANADYITLLQNFGNTVTACTQGDCTGDGLVSNPDFILLRQTLGDAYACIP